MIAPSKEQIEAAIEGYAPYTKLADAYKIGLFALKLTAKLEQYKPDDMPDFNDECKLYHFNLFRSAFDQAIKEVLDE